MIISPERKKQLNQNLMMFFTGFTRFSSEVQKANAADKVDKTAQLREMLSLVDDAEKVLTDKEKNLDDFGRLLDHTWKLKRQTGSAVSTNSIDELYAKVLLPARWAENFSALVVVGSLYFMYSQNIKMQFVWQCATYSIFRSNLKMVEHV